MKRIFVLLLALLLALALFAGCDVQNGRVSNSPDVTLTPGNTPGHTPTITDVPAPTATHLPSATPGPLYTSKSRISLRSAFAAARMQLSSCPIVTPSSQTSARSRGRQEPDRRGSGRGKRLTSPITLPGAAGPRARGAWGSGSSSPCGRVSTFRARSRAGRSSAAPGGSPVTEVPV